MAERQRCLDMGAFECFSVLAPLETIISHIRGLYENTWLRRQLRHWIVKEKEEILLDYNPDLHLYNKERYLTLEEHVKILESYKREAESCIVMMEEENLKMKAEVLTLKEKLEKTTGQVWIDALVFYCEEHCWSMEAGCIEGQAEEGSTQECVQSPPQDGSTERRRRFAKAGWK